MEINEASFHQKQFINPVEKCMVGRWPLQIIHLSLISKYQYFSCFQFQFEFLPRKVLENIKYIQQGLSFRHFNAEKKNYLSSLDFRNPFYILVLTSLQCNMLVIFWNKEMEYLENYMWHLTLNKKDCKRISWKRTFNF